MICAMIKKKLYIEEEKLVELTWQWKKPKRNVLLEGNRISFPCESNSVLRTSNKKFPFACISLWIEIKTRWEKMIFVIVSQSISVKIDEKDSEENASLRNREREKRIRRVIGWRSIHRRWKEGRGSNGGLANGKTETRRRGRFFEDVFARSRVRTNMRA